MCSVLCRLLHMATNLAIDDDLLRKAQKAGGFSTKKATVNEALRLFIRHQKQQKATELFGTVEWERSYDYKRQRRRR